MTPSPIRTSPRRYRIVIGTDLSEYADIVIEHALDQASRHDAPELHFLTVKEKRREDQQELAEQLWERVRPALETFNKGHVDWRARLHVRRGKPEEVIALLAAEIRADLIVIGQFGLHNPRHAEQIPSRVLQAAVCPTLVVGMPEPIESVQQCPMCVAVREETEGMHWFCSSHVSDRVEHTMTPMTTWTGGSLMW
ncbi:MAG: universal stress protein [Deltaproteobacteria bacterium]|nr:universal stress protein [Deltaproteobacteria bacterium]